jgi:ABC-type multidrug transport system fused ATPase/permease subunit
VSFYCVSINFILANRRLTRQSIFSITNSDISDENPFETSLKEFSKKKKRFRTPFFYKVLQLNTPEWHWILLGAITSLGLGGIQPLFGIIFSNIYGSFASPDVNEQERISRMYAIISFSIGIGGGVLQWLSSVSFAKSGEALTMRMRKLIFSALLRQEMSYFDHESNSTGALVTRLSSDASALKVISSVKLKIFVFIENNFSHFIKTARLFDNQN